MRRSSQAGGDGWSAVPADLGGRSIGSGWVRLFLVETRTHPDISVLLTFQLLQYIILNKSPGTGAGFRGKCLLFVKQNTRERDVAIVDKIIVTLSDK